MLEPLLFCLGLAQDYAVDTESERTLDHVLLVAAQHDAVGIVEQQRLAALRQRNDDVSCDAVEKLRVLVEHLALQNAQDIAERHIVNVRIYYRQQAVRCDIACRERSVKRTVLVYDGDDRYLLLAHHVPCAAHRDRGVERRRRVEIKVAHLSADIVYHARRLEAELIEHTLSFVACMSETGSHILPVAERIAQRRIAHRRDDRIGVGIAVTHHKDLIH